MQRRTQPTAPRGQQRAAPENPTKDPLEVRDRTESGANRLPPSLQAGPIEQGKHSLTPDSGPKPFLIAISSDVEHRLIDISTGGGAFPLVYAQLTGVLLD